MNRADRPHFAAATASSAMAGGDRLAVDHPGGDGPPGDELPQVGHRPPDIWAMGSSQVGSVWVGVVAPLRYSSSKVLAAGVKRMTTRPLEVTATERGGELFAVVAVDPGGAGADGDGAQGVVGVEAGRGSRRRPRRAPTAAPSSASGLRWKRCRRPHPLANQLGRALCSPHLWGLEGGDDGGQLPFVGYRVAGGDRHGDRPVGGVVDDVAGDGRAPRCCRWRNAG